MREKFTVEVAADQFDKFARVSQPLAGIEQLIWNSLDAEATKVTVSLELTELGAVEEVIVTDDGIGMTYDEARNGFEELGNSWKKDKTLTKNDVRTLHGRDGEGRFRAFALGKSVTWTSFAESANGNIVKVQVSGSVDDGRFEISVEDTSGNLDPGTVVQTRFPRAHVRKLLADDASTRLVIRLASFLARYPDVVIEYNDDRLTIESILRDSKSIRLEGVDGSHPDPLLEWGAPRNPDSGSCIGFIERIEGYGFEESEVFADV